MTNEKTFAMDNLQSGYFNTAIWIDLVERIAALFNLSEYQRNELKKNKLAKLIGAIPFLSNCDEPFRTSLSHLTITCLASHPSGKDIFLHKFSDNLDILKRLAPISHFPNGNTKIIEKGMALLAVIMIADHKKDLKSDQLKNKYNPIDSGIWEYNKELQKLKRTIESIKCPEMDELLSFNEAKALWWEWF